MSSLLSCVLLLVVCAFYGVNSTEYVPVFMWGATAGSSHNTRGLSKLDASSFKNVLLEQLDSQPFTVVFIEETLSVEDFSSKDTEGRTSYPGLREKMTGDSVLYYPYVASALHSLNQLADPKKIDRIQLTEDGLSADITPGSGQFLYISLKDAKEGEDRMHMLSRHDQFMTEMFDKLLKKHDSVLSIYTARQPSWSPVAPEISHVEKSSNHRASRSLLAVNWTSVANPENGFYNGTAGLNMFVFASTIKVLDSVDPTYLIELKSGAVRAVANTTLWDYVLWLDFAEANVKFSFTVGNDSYWDLGVTLSQEGSEIVMDNTVTAAYDFSYHCSPLVNFTTVNSTRVVSIEDFQAEIFIRSLINNHYNLAYDCVGFTSVPIWSGLFITLLMLFIVSIGITMMMDIRTMDRFDDPKGKTITITTTE